MTNARTSIDTSTSFGAKTVVLATSICLAVNAAGASAGIPQPDSVFYGTISVNGRSITAQDDVTVSARVAGSSTTIGVYKMGQSPTTGDNYVLRVRLESGVDGSPATDNAARIGDAIDIFVRLNDVCDGGSNDGGVCAGVDDCPGGGACGSEELVSVNGPIFLGTIGAVVNLDLPPSVCDSIRPRILHTNDVTTLCSGYIDPRRESNNGTDVNQGLMSLTMVLDEEVRSIGGGSLSPASFVVTETGGGSPPSIASVAAKIVNGQHVVTISFDRPITLREWTTVQAVVEDVCGNQIENVGNMGASVNEPDRIDIGFLPGDIDQRGSTQPLDLFMLRAAIVNGTLPPNTCAGLSVVDLADVDRNGVVEPIDVFFYRQLINGVGASTRPWGGAVMANTRP
jgi:hypothetical protein